MSKPMTREELLRLGAAVVNGDEDVLEAFGHAMRHLAALLPAEGLPPIDKDDERTVDALVAAKTGRARRMVTHSCPSCEAPDQQNNHCHECGRKDTTRACVCTSQEIGDEQPTD